MARVVSVGILPGGALSEKPASRAARLLRDRYSEIQAGEHELPLTAMKVFRQVEVAQIAGGVRPLSITIRRGMPRDVFEGDHVSFPGGVGMRERINRRALARIAKACTRRIRAAPARLPKILGSPDATYTHVLASPNAYMACMRSMGWDVCPPFLDPMGNPRLRISQESQSHRLASLKLAVAIDYAVPDGSIYCVDSSGMLLAMGQGKITYGYEKEELLVSQEYYLASDRANAGAELITNAGRATPRKRAA